MSRQVINLNREWRFFRGDIPSAEVAEFDDSAWQHIGLPHTFDLPYFRTPEFFVGVGWYRRHIEVPQRTLTPTLSRGTGRGRIEFDGVFQVCDVFVNGTHVGGHRGGYTGFCIDITDALRSENNLIAIRVDNNWDAQLAPRAGEHIFCGGIYRDVRLVLTDTLHVPWCGHVITTPQVSRDSAIARVQTQVRNQSLAPSRCRIETSVINPEGALVARMSAEHELAPGETFTFDQTSEPIANPKLWHPDHPHLYQAVSEVFADGALVDRVQESFGFRWFQWTSTQGFFLNGEHLYLRGANAHQDHAGWGIGITAAACERDVRLIKEAGFNFVRGAHYPHHPAFAEACDRFGLLFWSEATFWGKGGFGPEGYWNASAYPANLDDGPAFEQSCLDQLAEMIRINRNHPSIIAWSMCNEPFFTYHLDRARDLLKKMVGVSRQLDPTRPAAIGGAQRGDIDHIGDIAGYNGDGARLFIDPSVPNMVSEYGAISKPPESFEPFFGEKQDEHFPWRAGEAIWCGFDYGSIAGKQGLKGILDHQRLPKQSWHWYRKHNLGIDAPLTAAGVAAGLGLSADKRVITGTDATDDVQLIVSVVDARGTHVNANPPVTLAIERGPGEFPTGRSITFDELTDNKIARGMAATALRSYHGGETLIRATSPGLGDATITITTTGQPCWVEGVSRPCEERRYVAPRLSESAQRAMASVVNVALNRPSRASSEADGKLARQANDGDAQTMWQCGSADAPPWWQVDLEGFYQISGSKITFPAEGNWRFVIQTSVDGVRWIDAVDRRDRVTTTAVRNDIYPPGTTARYWRLAFSSLSPGVLASLAEVEVHGVLSTK